MFCLEYGEFTLTPITSQNTLGLKNVAGNGNISPLVTQELQVMEILVCLKCRITKS